MNSLYGIKTVEDNLEVEYEVLTPIDLVAIKDPARRELALAIQDVDTQLDLCQQEVQKLDAEIDRLTNHADGLDYTIAVASGILTGLIDSFFVGELDLQECHKYGSEKVEKTVKRLGKSEDLEKAIKKLEEKTKKFFPSDSNMNSFGGARQHHLRDFAHHPTPVGLVCSLLTQFTGNCYGTNTAGSFIVEPVQDKSRIGDTVPKKIIYGTLYWYLHLVSDMAGSSGHAGGGTGLPGPLLSLAKTLSTLPFFKKLNKDGNKEISVFISKLFSGTLYAKKDATGKIIPETVVPIDLRTEIGILHKQALPVIINECIVRAFYSIRRFGMELQEHPVSSFEELKQLDWKKIIPFGNRTVERMMTIATGTFTAVDIADAAIRSGGFNATCLLRVNFVGVGRFIIAIGVDVGMGVKRSKLINERMAVMSKELTLLNAKVYYKCAEIHFSEVDMMEAQQVMWLTAQDTQQALLEAYSVAEESVLFIQQSISEIRANLEKISEYKESIEKYNPGLPKDIINITRFGRK